MSNATTPLAEVRGLSKRFGEKRIFDNADASLDAGRAYVLTGDNGSGKSTFLRILAGLEPADGTLRFGTARFALDAYPQRIRRDIVYVHQHPYLFHTSLAKNIGYGLRARGVTAATRIARVSAAIAWARLEGLLETPVDKLSGGERQRAALARVKVLEPGLLLLDEPTSNLDAESRAQVIELVAALCAGGKTTVLIACHDLDLIELPGISRLHIEDGRVAAG